MDLGDAQGPSKLIVGVVGRAVGLKGEVEVAVTSDEPGRFSPGSVLETHSRALTIANVRTRGDRTIVRFEGVADRTAAEGLRGTELTIPSTAARPLDDDEYWDHDLIGCDVETIDGELVGRVTEVLHQPANAVLVVEGDREYLIPLIRDVVRSVEPRRRITVDPLPGLLDD